MYAVEIAVQRLLDSQRLDHEIRGKSHPSGPGRYRRTATERTHASAVRARVRWQRAARLSSRRYKDCCCACVAPYCARTASSGLVVERIRSVSAWSASTSDSLASRSAIFSASLSSLVRHEAVSQVDTITKMEDLSCDPGSRSRARAAANSCEALPRGRCERRDGLGRRERGRRRES